MTSRSLDDIEEERLEEVRQRCEAFEKAWQNGLNPRLEAVLDGVPDPDYWLLLRHALRMEWELLRNAGRPINLRNYLGGRFRDDSFVLRVFAEELPQITGYEILRELGHGGMGVVYLARDEGLDRLVALKLLLPGGDRESFLREARAVAAMEHTHVVPVHEVNEPGELPYFAMEYCPGGTLADRLARAPLPLDDAATLVERLARGIQATHERGRIHRDVKPANVLLFPAETPTDPDEPAPACRVRECWYLPKLGDFGLALRLDEAGRWGGGIAGTFGYMAPEQARGDSSLTRAVDIYALGAVLYECLTGRPPFQAATVAETLRQIIEVEPVSPRRLNPAVDRALEFICLKCLEKDPARRYPSAAELAEDLNLWLDCKQARRPGFFEGLRRQFQAPCRVEQPGEWAGTCFALAGWRLVCHAGMVLLLLSNAAPAAYWAWFVGLHAGVWLLVGLLRPGRLDLTERGVLLNWAATTAADALLLGLFCPLWGEARPEEVVRVYPAWLTLHGLWYVMEARRFWGRCYTVGFGFLLVVPVLSLFGPWAPLAYGLLNAAMLVWLGDGLRRLARQREEARGGMQTA